MVSQLQSVSTVDLYYICQIVDNVAGNHFPYLRKVEDIFGDMSSISLTRSYPKWTCFHIFIEEVISSIVEEEADADEVGNRVLWVDHLLKANGLEVEVDCKNKLSSSAYIESLIECGELEMLCENIAKQVFHVLFSNRSTMLSFGNMISFYVSETAPIFSPAAFDQSRNLKRVNPPMWAKSAVFHRDKGRCVLCKTDLTKLFSQQSAIHYDHIVPLAKGGMNCVTNLQLTCSNCNASKGARSTDTSNKYEVWYDY